MSRQSSRDSREEESSQSFNEVQMGDFVPKGLFKQRKNTLTLDHESEETAIKVTEKQTNEFMLLEMPTQELIIRTTLRVLLMKGGRNEPVVRADISKALANVDTSFKRYVPAALAQAQEMLPKYYGFGMVAEGAITDIEGTAEGKLYTFSVLKSPRVAEVLARNDMNKAFRGFVFVVMHAIWSSPGRIINQQELLRKVREVDNRFPASIEAVKAPGSRDKSSAAIEELGMDFISLVNRAKREGYVVQSRADGAHKDDEISIQYTLGGRFYIEIGKEALAASYFDALGQELDEGVLGEIQEENREIQKRRDKVAAEKFAKTAAGRRAAADAAAAAQNDMQDEENLDARKNPAPKTKTKTKKRKNEIDDN